MTLGSGSADLPNPEASASRRETIVSDLQGQSKHDNQRIRDAERLQPRDLVMNDTTTALLTEHFSYTPLVSSPDLSICDATGC